MLCNKHAIVWLLQAFVCLLQEERGVKKPKKVKNSSAEDRAEIQSSKDSGEDAGVKVPRAKRTSRRKAADLTEGSEGSSESSSAPQAPKERRIRYECANRYEW